MAERPIILTVFSDVEDPNPLPRLVEERDEIIDLLKTPDQQKRIEHKYLSVKDGEQLMAYIRTYREEIFIFHYAGHADSNEIFLPDGRSLMEGIAGYFRIVNRHKSPLKLVFLNGCATQAQVDSFFNIGVDAVIATRAKIGDTPAKEFATTFYKALFREQETLEQAFNDAVAQVKRLSDEIQVEQEPLTDRGPKKERLKQIMENGEQMPWFLYTRREEILKSAFLPKKSTSAMGMANKPIQKDREADIKAKREEIDALRLQIQAKEAAIATGQTNINALEQVPMEEPQKQMILKTLKDNLVSEQIKLKELKNKMDLLSLEVEENAEGFLHAEALKRLKNALYEINYSDQLRYFIRQVDPNETFRAFILQGTKDCANDLLVHLLLIDFNGDEEVGIDKLELDFSINGNDAPTEENIWEKVKQHFKPKDGSDEKAITSSILEKLQHTHIIFHFKRMLKEDPKYNLQIIKKFWYTFSKFANAEEPVVPYLNKCYLFVSDVNCSCRNEAPYVLERGYKNIIPERDRVAYSIDISIPPIQPILFDELDRWVDKVPRIYRLTEANKLKEVLDGRSFGYILPTIRKYCEKNGSQAIKIYEADFLQYEINQQA